MYKEANSINGVAEFHEVFGHPILQKPVIPSQERCNLRLSLIQEELNEMKQAIDEKNLVDVIDALCDIQYVLSGAIHEFGLGDSFNQFFAEVQRSNMSKACKDETEAKRTVDKYSKEGIECYFEKRNEYYVVYRLADHKIMKSINYSPANLKEILSNY